MRRPCDERACGCSDARMRATCVFIESRSPRLPDFVSPAWHRDRANPRSRVNFPEPPAENARKPRLIRSRRESTNQKARFRRVPYQSRIVAKTDFHPCRPRPGKPQKCTGLGPLSQLDRRPAQIARQPLLLCYTRSSSSGAARRAETTPTRARYASERANRPRTESDVADREAVGCGRGGRCPRPAPEATPRVDFFSSVRRQANFAWSDPPGWPSRRPGARARTRRGIAPPRRSHAVDRFARAPRARDPERLPPSRPGR